MPFSVDRPMLGLVHFDWPNRRVREDYYYLHTPKPTRFFSSIRFYLERRAYMIYHRVRDASLLSSPMGCYIVPAAGAMPGPRDLESAYFLGRETIAVRGGANATHSVDVHSWAWQWDGIQYDLFSSAASDRPVAARQANVNYTVVDFQTGPSTVRPALFLPHLASPVQCEPIGGRHVEAARRHAQEQRPLREALGRLMGGLTGGAAAEPASRVLSKEALHRAEALHRRRQSEAAAPKAKAAKGGNEL
jgi:hypothetical protein